MPFAYINGCYIFKQLCYLNMLLTHFIYKIHITMEVFSTIKDLGIVIEHNLKIKHNADEW